MSPDDIMGMDLPEFVPVEYSEEARRQWPRRGVRTGQARNCRNAPEQCRVITDTYSEVTTYHRMFWRLRTTPPKGFTGVKGTGERQEAA